MAASILNTIPNTLKWAAAKGSEVEEHVVQVRQRQEAQLEEYPCQVVCKTENLNGGLPSQQTHACHLAHEGPYRLSLLSLNLVCCNEHNAKSSG